MVLLKYTYIIYSINKTKYRKLFRVLKRLRDFLNCSVLLRVLTAEIFVFACVLN
jgi:hypothetical protein